MGALGACAFPTRPIAPPGEADQDASRGFTEPCVSAACGDASIAVIEPPSPMDQRSMRSRATHRIVDEFYDHEHDGTADESDAAGIVIEAGAPSEGANAPQTNPRLVP